MWVLAFVDPTSVLVHRQKRFLFIKIVAFVGDEIVCFAFKVLHENIVASVIPSLKMPI